LKKERCGSPYLEIACGNWKFGLFIFEFCVLKYRHLFFDLDHTLWDFDKNSAHVLEKLFEEYHLQERGIPDFDSFLKVYVLHNNRMWERFRNGFIKREDLRWKRIWLTLLDFKIGDTSLAHEMSAAYLELLPAPPALAPYAKVLL